MRARDSFLAQNFTSATQGPFNLLGGKYGAVYMAAAWGTMNLNVLGPNGSTFIPAAQQWSANGTTMLLLPAGTYQPVPSGITAGYFELVRVPGE